MRNRLPGLAGVDEDSQRGPLDRARLVRAALALVDEVGVEGLTMRALAERLDVRAASLYWHVRNKRELLELLVEAIATQLQPPDPDRPWREELEAFAIRYRRLLLEHRDAARIMSGFNLTPATYRHAERLLELLHRAGFGLEDAENASFTIANYVPWFVAEETLGAARYGGLASGPAAADDGRGELSAPLGGVTEGRLEFHGGVVQVTVGVDAVMPHLYRARFDGRPPSVEASGGTVAIRQRRGRRNRGELTLNGSIPWRVEVLGGAVRLNADLAALRLRSLEVGGGASEVTIVLPPPAGTVPLRVSSGVRALAVHRPPDVPARVRVAGGAVKLRLDDSYLAVVGGATQMETPGYAAAADRYDIEITGGASGLTVDTAAGRVPPGSENPLEEARRHLRSLPPDEFPNLVALADRLVAGDLDNRFHFCLGVILDGLESRLGHVA